MRGPYDLCNKPTPTRKNHKTPLAGVFLVEHGVLAHQACHAQPSQRLKRTDWCTLCLVKSIECGGKNGANAQVRRNQKNPLAPRTGPGRASYASGSVEQPPGSLS